MYVGRIVAIGKSRAGKLVAMYRVSARSFPNRKSVQNGEAIVIVPKEGFEQDIYRNPYITYNCLRQNRRYAVVGNGTQTDPIFEKLESGMTMRDAMASVLFGMDYEHDHLKTPRISAVIDREEKSAYLAIVKADAILVRSFQIEPGEAFYLATYDHDFPDERFKDMVFDVAGAEEACDYVLGKGVFANLELPVSAACAVETEDGFSIAHKDVR
jgi:IMP cyclohydrolase